MSKVDSNWKICLLENIVRVFFFVTILLFLASPSPCSKSVDAVTEPLSSQLLSPLSKRTSLLGSARLTTTASVDSLHSGFNSATNSNTV